MRQLGPAVSRWARRLLVWGAPAFLSLLAGLLITPAVPALGRWLTGDWRDPDGSSIFVVLSAEQLGDGTIGLTSYWRSVYAVRHWREAQPRLIVVAGGHLAGAQQPSVAAVMGDFLVSQGVPRAAIKLEEHSYSTRENALGTIALLRALPGGPPAGPIALVTSDCHMRRARQVFRRAGLEVVPVPVPDIGKRWNSWPDRPACIYLVFVELAKTAYYAYQGWT